MNDAKVTRIVLAGDPRLLRESLRHVLDCEPDFEVVGEADAGLSVVRAVVESQPDVLLLDISMADGDPQELLRELLANRPELGVIVLTNHSEQRLMERLLELGVRAYLHKNISPGTLKSTIRDLVGTSRRTVMITLPRPKPLPVKVPPDPREPPEPFAGAGLSERELEVLTFVADALTNRQIASRMDIAEGTVKRHLRNVFHKLGASSRIDAVNKALDARLIQPPWV
ncbi:response regulator transcription factor [Dactylosporangium roseum]|uniref:Response regulator transcription factor n=1 Tax=Dactylosporangium roseum TaxID=47989 RepID=A0ABY5YZX2_9ACTN|nr:response regulator transcription factor [Dactylosporangium roseum]UWZ34365.1 response regulator transcription factor [Dactylosporangium roseum]